MKEYKHRQLEQCVNMNVKSVRNYVLPQAQAFGLSWFIAKDHGYSPRCTKEYHLDTTGWRSPPDPTDNRMDDKGPVEVPAQALGLMSVLGARTRPSVRRGMFDPVVEEVGEALACLSLELWLEEPLKNNLFIFF